jgi:hypothetical protein
MTVLGTKHLQKKSANLLEQKKELTFSTLSTAYTIKITVVSPADAW